MLKHQYVEEEEKYPNERESPSLLDSPQLESCATGHNPLTVDGTRETIIPIRQSIPQQQQPQYQYQMPQQIPFQIAAQTQRGPEKNCKFFFTKKMIFQWILSVAVLSCYAFIWFGDASFISAKTKEPDTGYVSVLIPELTGTQCIWKMDKVLYKKKQKKPTPPPRGAIPRFPGTGNRLGGRPENPEDFGEKKYHQLTTDPSSRGMFNWMSGVLKWGTLIPLILASLVVVLYTLRFFWQSRAHGLSHVGRIFVGLAHIAPFFVIIDLLMVFSQNGPTFVQEQDGKLSWEFENGFILHCAAAILMIILEISDCF